MTEVQQNMSKKIQVYGLGGEIVEVSNWNVVVSNDNPKPDAVTIDIQRLKEELWHVLNTDENFRAKLMEDCGQDFIFDPDLIEDDDVFLTPSGFFSNFKTTGNPTMYEIELIYDDKILFDNETIPLADLVGEDHTELRSSQTSSESSSLLQYFLKTFKRKTIRTYEQLVKEILCHQEARERPETQKVSNENTVYYFETPFRDLNRIENKQTEQMFKLAEKDYSKQNPNQLLVSYISTNDRASDAQIRLCKVLREEEPYDGLGAKSLVHLQLESCSIDDTVFEHFYAPALEFNKHIQSFKVWVDGYGDNFNLEPEGAAMLGEILKVNQGLRRLKLGYHHFGDTAGFCEKFINGLRENRTLQELTLYQCEIGDKGCLLLAEIISNSDTNKTALRKLNVGRNRITGAAAVELLKGVAKNKEFLGLFLAWTELGEEFFSILVEQILKNHEHKLCELGLTHSQMTDEAVSILVEGLKENKMLKKLNLEGQRQVTLVGFKELVEKGLKHHPTLLYLNLGKFGEFAADWEKYDESTEILAEFIRENRHCKILELERFWQISGKEEGRDSRGTQPRHVKVLAEAIAQNGKTGSLKKLNLAYNNMKDGGMAVLVEEGMLKNGKIEYWNLNANHINDEGCSALLDGILENIDKVGHLRTILFTPHGFRDQKLYEKAETVWKQLPKMKEFIFGRGWRGEREFWRDWDGSEYIHIE